MLDRKTILVATREYMSTVMTKAFFFGAIILPIVIYGLAIAIPTLVKDDVPQMNGTIAIVDETGQVGGLLQLQLSPSAIDLLKDGLKNLSEENIRKEIERELGSQKFAAGLMASASVRQIRKLREIPTPQITFRNVLVNDVDLDALKQEVRDGDLLGVIHIREGALNLPESTLSAVLGQGMEELKKEDANENNDEKEEEPEYLLSLFTEKTMHIENSGFLRSQISQAIVSLKVIQNNVNPDLVRRVTSAPYVRVVNVTEQGEHQANEMADMMVPFGFMMLLWISTFTGGQYLLTTTVEEKSSKVIEVLLSATSPIQLMAGKIIGQGAVALTMVAMYGLLAGGAVSNFAGDSVHIDPWSIVLVAPFFVMAFFFVACMMAAVGSVVNDMREAQALMGPMMMIIMLPLLAWLPIVRSPDGTFATVASFVPPMTPFVMALRLASKQPPDWMQITATLVIGYAAVVISIWATAKIFRIGVLMTGKPPSIKTLFSWLRQA